MSELIQSLRILDEDGRSLFDTEARYVVPLYQRAFAWKEEEILQLVHDIRDMDAGDGAHYYLGSLIVSRNGVEYEVIDGQQRLTTLCILLQCLAEKGILPPVNPQALRFSCRDKSNYTLRHLFCLGDHDPIEESIRAGRDIVWDELNRADFPLESFVGRLRNVILYRIEVPENTDLIRYFEIMNTRGEQLEQHDILKATLMSYMEDSRARAWFARIWDACSDMTGYVQTHFDTKATNVLFGSGWNDVPSFESLADLGEDVDRNTGDSATIRTIIREDFRTEAITEADDHDGETWFESVIDFPFFLLHTLRVFISVNHIDSKDDSKLTDRLLDDKKLIAGFDRVLSNGIMDGKPVSDQRERFACEFIRCLLRCRTLFDRYIIKRQYTKKNSEGQWTLKELQVSGRKSKKKDYRQTTFGNTHERQSVRKRRSECLLMLQSCLRVSYTSPKVMHWITELLTWLETDQDARRHQLAAYEDVTEEIARTAVREYLDVCRQKQPPAFDLGVDTPHIVFNYLDYLLWKESGEAFTFEFRNSVEHWYPQHPSEGSFERWSHEDGLDNFGNLCIIQRNVNARFSNFSPESKKSNFEDMIRKGSLKLRRMAALTEPGDGQTASARWRREVYKQHEQAMIDRLTAACDE